MITNPILSTARLPGVALLLVTQTLAQLLHPEPIRSGTSVGADTSQPASPVAQSHQP